MEDFILSVLAGLATSYIAYLCSKIKNHLFNGRRKSGYEFELKFKFKKFYCIWKPYSTAHRL